MSKISTNWDQFNRNKKILSPSNFAIFVSKRINKKGSLLDIGCGDGRDSFFLQSKICP